MFAFVIIYATFVRCGFVCASACVRAYVCVSCVWQRVLFVKFVGKLTTSYFRLISPASFCVVVSCNLPVFGRFFFRVFILLYH